jgi:hypothetical protein
VNPVKYEVTMSLKVMYVEDTQSDVKALRDALRTANKGLPDWSKVILRPVSHPSELPGALSEYPDVVLADVLFLPEGATPPAPATDHLDAIIKGCTAQFGGELVMKAA